MEIRVLKTHAEVVDALGGKEAFAALISDRKNRRKANHVGNYLRDKFFPANTEKAVADALQKICCSAPLSLWPDVVKPKNGPPQRRAA